MQTAKEKETSSAGDLTRGPIIKKLLLFFLPIAAGTLFQQLYNAVDAFVVSKYVGTDALAAVGGTPAIVSNLIIGFCSSLTAGCGVVIAQFYGAKNEEAVSRSVRISYVFSALTGIFVGAAVILFSEPILTVLKTPADTFADAMAYQNIYFSGCVFLLLYNMGSGVLRAVGNSRFPFYCLFISCGINIALDLTFVALLGWGVEGVAWATVIAQGVSALLVTGKLLTAKGCYRLQCKGALDFSLLKRMLKIGFPSGLQSSMYGISNMILQVGVNSLGTVVVASWAMSGKVDGIFWAVSGAFGTAVTTFVGQNWGAGNYGRVRRAGKKGFFLFLLITLSLCSLLLLFGMPILRLLTNDGAVVETTWTLMLYFVPFYVLWTVIEICSGVLRGMGKTVVPSVITALGICVFRVLWMVTVFRMSPILSSLCICYPVSWLVTDIPIGIYYLNNIKTLPRQDEKEKTP